MKHRRRKFKLKITEHGINPEDREAILNKQRHIADLKIRAKKVSKDNKDLIKIFQKEIKSVRKELINNYAHKFYLITLSLGPHKEEQYASYYPESKDIESIKETLLSRLSKDRANRKEFFTVKRRINGIEYQMVGSQNNSYEIAPTSDYRPSSLTWAEARAAQEPLFEDTLVQNRLLPNLKGGGNVFMESGSILKMLSGPAYAQRILKAKKPYDKSNYIGVEIELVCRVSRETLEAAFINSKLASNLYIKSDSSIQRESTDDWTHEITILGKQQNINDIITRTCEVLNNKEISAYVNDSCGIHIHIDMRNRDYVKCFKNFVNALPVLTAMVPASRTQSSYCSPNVSVDPTYTRGNSNLDRRQAINPKSYEAYKTIEVRLHSGSTNATKINNWINILTAIAEHNNTVDFKLASPEDMQQVFGVSSKLVEYMKNRITKFKDKTIDTKADHFDQAI